MLSSAFAIDRVTVCNGSRLCEQMGTPISVRSCRWASRRVPFHPGPRLRLRRPPGPLRSRNVDFVILVVRVGSGRTRERVTPPVAERDRRAARRPPRRARPRSANSLIVALARAREELWVSAKTRASSRLQGAPEFFSTRAPQRQNRFSNSTAAVSGSAVGQGVMIKIFGSTPLVIDWPAVETHGRPWPLALLLEGDPEVAFTRDGPQVGQVVRSALSFRHAMINLTRRHNPQLSPWQRGHWHK